MSDKKHVATITLGDDVITLTSGRTRSYDKCVIAHYQGVQGWGVTMNIRPVHVSRFTGDEAMQREFIALAKDK